MVELTPRQERVLGQVIKAYVATAQPVSSKSLLEIAGMRVSSATIRNEMAELEELGYLTHPHTSAGRVPTDAGYRYFVEHLLGESELPLQEQNTIRHQFHQARTEMSQWMQLAAAVLARSARSASLVTAPRLDSPILRRLELISTQSRLVLLVLVLEGGTVRQRILTLKEPMTQEALSQVGAKLNGHYAGDTSFVMRSKFGGLAEFEQDVMALVVELMETGGQSSTETYRDGLKEVLREPEFTDQDGARAIVGAIEQPDFFDQITPPVGTVQVVIGGEGRWRELSACSMVVARYGVEGYATGTLGVLGPTRMPYSRAISTVRYVADLMSNLVSDLYAE